MDRCTCGLQNNMVTLLCASSISYDWDGRNTQVDFLELDARLPFFGSKKCGYYWVEVDQSRLKIEYKKIWNQVLHYGPYR